MAEAGSGERLIELSVVLDGRPPRLAPVGLAALASRLGFDVWWREPPLAGPATGGPVAEVPAVGEPAGDAGPAGVPALLAALRDTAGPRRVGLILDLDPPGTGEAPRTAGTALAAEALAAGCRLALVGRPESVAGVLGSLPVTRRSQIIVQYRPGQPTPDEHSGTVLVPVTADGDLDALVAGAVAANGQGHVLAEIPVSIGRTTAEAHARAASETLFEVTGHPAQHGLFGTLEQCQYRAAELAHAGVAELACHIPGSRDVADVLAQLRAVATVGRHALRPGEPPSPAPPPPVGWGGRRVANADTREP